jgi:hypothetical protein
MTTKAPADLSAYMPAPACYWCFYLGTQVRKGKPIDRCARDYAGEIDALPIVKDAETHTCERYMASPVAYQVARWAWEKARVKPVQLELFAGGI